MRVLEFVDFCDVPFSVPKSRFLLRYLPQELGEEDAAGDVAGVASGEVKKLGLYYVRYEVPLAQCLVLTLLASEVKIFPGRVITPHWELALFEDTCLLTFTGESDGQILNLNQELDSGYMRNFAQLPTPQQILAPAHAAQVACVPLTRGMFLHGKNTQITAAFREKYLDFADPILRAKRFGQAADRCVQNWMEKVPHAKPSRQKMVEFCWWVLGVNQIQLPRKEQGAVSELPRSTIVVPSLLGYVGLWQWDAYFIALGLQHGDLDLALAQLDIAFSPAPAGNLPDVVHENGILASSADLPANDLPALRERGNLRPGEVVPLTKPPLGAWAAAQVLAKLPAAQQLAYLQRWYPILAANQEWWYAPQNCDAQGRPQYLHPYSSGLDDSPVFDAAGAVVCPDLLAYLIVQELTLQKWAAQLGAAAATAAQVQSEKRLRRLRTYLSQLWDQEKAGYFAQNQAGTRPYRTIISLLACFAPQIPAAHLAGIVRDICDRKRFGLNWALPTVAADDCEFAEETMWRGPVWVNTNYLVAHGLVSNGQGELAQKLRQQTLDLLESAGGPMEYFNAATGKRCARATTCFGWSAALYIDLAMQEKAALAEDALID